MAVDVEVIRVGIPRIVCEEESLFFRYTRLVLIDRVRAELAGIRGVEEKKMFGATAFMVGGKMCVNVGKRGLMCRIDPELHGELVKRKGVETVVMRGRPYRGSRTVAGPMSLNVPRRSAVRKG